MPFISRQYVFKNDEDADANQVNAELDTIHELVNGNITAENLKDKTITKEKMGFELASPKYRGDVPTVAELSLLPNIAHMDIATVSADMDMYAYDDNTRAWKKISGTVATVSHATLTGRNAPNSHTIDAITGLQEKVNEYDQNITALQTKTDTADDKLATQEGRIESAEADIAETILQLTQTFKTGANGKAMDISGQDMNNLRTLPSGYYAGNNLVNAPNTNYYHILNLVWNNVAYQYLMRQSATAYGEHYVRTYDTTNNQWAAWKQIHSGDEPTFQAGIESIKVSAINTIITHRVTFSKPFKSAPSISLTPVTGDPRILSYSVSTVTAAFFDIILVRTNNTVDTSIHWTACDRT